MSDGAQDLWHVRIAPGEVKVLTLEQVDDLYRLDMIEPSTLLWQQGMSGWLPLRVVAGLDDEPEAPAAQAAPSPKPQVTPAVPPPKAQLAPAVPPPKPQLPPVAQLAPAAQMHRT